jgi:hypothetical protein
MIKSCQPALGIQTFAEGTLSRRGLITIASCSGRFA